MKRLLIGLAIFLLLVGFLVKEANSWWIRERELDFDITYDLDKGNNLSRISKELNQLGLIEYPMLFRFMVLYEGKFRVKAGHYKFVGKASPREVYYTLRDGKEFLEVVLTFTIPEGFTLNQVINRLAANKLASLIELQTLVNDRSLFEEFNIKGTTLEGYLYPDTYVYHNQLPTAKNVLRDLIKNFVKPLSHHQHH